MTNNTQTPSDLFVAELLVLAMMPSTIAHGRLTQTVASREDVLLDASLSVVHFVCEKTTRSLLATLICCPRSELVLARCGLGG